MEALHETTVAGLGKAVQRTARRAHASRVRLPDHPQRGCPGSTRRRRADRDGPATNLVSDLPGAAAVQDPNLVNSWGLTESSTSPLWVADNGSGLATTYLLPGVGNTPVSI